MMWGVERELSGRAGIGLGADPNRYSRELAMWAASLVMMVVLGQSGGPTVEELVSQLGSAKFSERESARVHPLDDGPQGASGGSGTR